MLGRGPLAVATVVAAAVGVAGCGAAAPPEEATTTIGVAVGVSLTAVFTELVEDFEAENHGVHVRLEPGRSVELARGMRGRTDLHLFAATGRSAMGIALADGSARDPRTFARNYMVLAVPSGNPAGVTRLADLARPELRVGLCIEDGACGLARIVRVDDRSEAENADAGIEFGRGFDGQLAGQCVPLPHRSGVIAGFPAAYGHQIRNSLSIGTLY